MCKFPISIGDFLNPLESIELLYRHNLYVAIGLPISIFVFFMYLMIRRSVKKIEIREHVPEIFGLNFSVTLSLFVVLSITYELEKEVAQSDIMISLFLLGNIMLVISILTHVRMHLVTQERLDRSIACTMGWALWEQRGTVDTRFRSLSKAATKDSYKLYPFNTHIRQELSEFRRRESSGESLGEIAQLVLRHDPYSENARGWLKWVMKARKWMWDMTLVALCYISFCFVIAMASQCLASILGGS
uniref:Uncharacterized protein n=1 Tax=Candidatus Kentrum sp. DK TaxID=2126562 RepID=A0A450SN41_9GAMM|nr:MAG: hypothetical protein BECKDK2373B_GA0170837_105118 [Candidatus Kentron sp. DK]